MCVCVLREQVDEDKCSDLVLNSMKTMKLVANLLIK